MPNNKNTVLIIEDSEVAMANLVRILCSDYTLYLAKNGHEGLKIAGEKKPDVILLDIIMPDIDGYEVIKVLKNDEKTKQIPIIFITVLSDDKDEEKGLALGAEDFIRKPFSDAIVKLRVEIQMRILNYIRTIDNFAEKERMQSELEEALNRANEASRAKTDFLAKMSHEIRTPMNAIIGMTELALREETPDGKDEHISTVKHAGHNLLAIINDILDFSKIEAGKMEIINSDYSVASLLEDVVSIIRMRVVDSQLRFAVKVDSNIPRTLCGDETRIRQAVLNIMSNAVKYTESGFVVFKVCMESPNPAIDSVGTVNLIFEVTDTGIGIKPENIDKLFTDFTQLDREKNKSIEGIGLGLAITQNIVKAMGGEIKVKSEYGKGSTFTIIIPQEYGSGEPLAKVDEPGKKSVLIYERRDVYVDTITYTTTNLGVDSTIVKSEDELSKSMKSRRYDYMFISFTLYKRNEETILKYGGNAKVIILAEFGEAIPEKNLNILAMPVYCTAIANVFNGEYGDLAYIATTEPIVRFTAPDARVLIVDDIHTNLKVAEGLLTPYSMSVELCNSGAAAVDVIKDAIIAKRHFHLIFMDHKMPGVDGIEATRRIREAGVTVPIIALTANAVEGMMEMFIENGFNDFLSKPIDTVKLNAILEKWIPKEMQM